MIHRILRSHAARDLALAMFVAVMGLACWLVYVG